jgi:hypothetical protein
VLVASNWKRECVVGRGTEYGHRRPRGRAASPGWVYNKFSTLSIPALETTQLPIQWIATALSPGVNRHKREADHSPSVTAEFNKSCAYTFITLYAFLA